MFSFLRVVCSAAEIPSHTHDCPFCPHSSHRLVVHRIRWRVESTGAGATEAIPCSSSFGRYHWHKWGREWCYWATAEVSFQEDVQDEESLGNECCWAILCEWAHRCCNKTQSFLLQNLSQGCVSADSWSPRDSEALPGQQTLSARSTFAIGDSRLGSAWLWVERHEFSRGRAPARKDHEGSFGRERQGVPILRGRPCWRNWCGGPESWVMAKVSSLIEVLRLGGSYELVYRLWAQFTLSAVPVNVDVTWSRDEVLVSSYWFAPCIPHGLCASNLFWLF